MTDPVYEFFINTSDDKKRSVYERALIKTQLDQARITAITAVEGLGDKKE